MDTFEKIRALLAEQLDIDPAKITMESDIMSDFEADSLDIVDMVMTLEDEFGIEVPDPQRCTRRRCSGAFNMSSCGTAGTQAFGARLRRI